MKTKNLLIFSLLLCATNIKAQNVAWATRAGGSDSDGISKMVRDHVGNLYVLGENSPASQFSNLYIANGGQFFAKIDTNGNYIFVV